MDPFSGMMMSGYGQFETYIQGPPPPNLIRPDVPACLVVDDDNGDDDDDDCSCASAPASVCSKGHGALQNGMCAICRWENHRRHRAHRKCRQMDLSFPFVSTDTV